MEKIKPTSRDAIIEAAFQLFSRKPGASLGEVADYAGVGRATLHRYFNSRQVLMRALAKTARTELNDVVELAVVDAKTHTEGLELALAAIIPLASRQWFISHETLVGDPESAAAQQADIAELHEEIEAARLEGSFTADLPTKWIAETYEGLIFAAWTMVRDQEATPRQAAALAWRTFMKGVSR